MARLVTNDCLFEGRQYDGKNASKIARWLEIDEYELVNELNKLNVITSSVIFFDERFDGGSVTMEIGDWLILDPNSREVVNKSPLELKQEMTMVSVHTEDKLDDGDNIIAVTSNDKIQKAFGFHKAAIEGPNAKAPIHAGLREEFVAFATVLDSKLPEGRYKSLTMTALEEASMWSHKSIANDK